MLTGTVTPIPVSGSGACHVESSRLDSKVECPYETTGNVINLYGGSTGLTKLKRHPCLRIERIGKILCQLRLLRTNVTNNQRYPLVSLSDIRDIDRMVVRSRHNVSFVIEYRDLKPIARLYDAVPIEICPNSRDVRLGISSSVGHNRTGTQVLGN